MAINLGQYLIKLLEAYDVDTVFGIPGVHTAELYRGLADSPIRHVTPRHEQGAGFMADGYARVTGRPGVCLVITGPGLANIATAMLQARAGSIPMLVIAGVNDPSERPLGRLHEMPDQFAFGAQVAAASWRIGEPEHLPAAMAEAFAMFESKRPGPALIEIPLSAMEADASALPAPARPDRYLAPLPGIDGLDAAAAMLDAAENPVLIAGGGALAAAALITALAERLQAPIVPTIEARAAFPLDHPLVVPASPTLPQVRDFIDAADLVLAIGTEFGPTDYDMYATGTMIKPKQLIRIDIDPEQRHGPIAADVFLIGDAAATLKVLTDRLTTDRSGNGAEDGVARINAATRGSLSAAYKSHISVLEILRNTLPDAVLVGDSTQLIYAGNMFFAPGNSGFWFNSAVGFGTLGYALPAALGAKIGRPDHPVIALIGDGGLQFTLGELGGLRDESAPIIVLVWNNRGYGEIKTYMLDHDVKPDGVDLTPPDFALVAKAYGIAYQCLSEADLTERLGDVLRAVNDTKKPAMIEVTAG